MKQSFHSLSLVLCTVLAANTAGCSGNGGQAGNEGETKRDADVAQETIQKPDADALDDALNRDGDSMGSLDDAGDTGQADQSRGNPDSATDSREADGPEELDVEEEIAPSPDYFHDDELRLNQIQVKGTHNSYHLVPDEVVYAAWNYGHPPLGQQLKEYGVRQVELDVHYHPGVGFRVYHVPILDDNSSCDTFVECLTILRNWSDKHPGHHTLFILVEPKDDIDPVSIVGHYEELDAEILSVWPRERIVTPDDVRGGYSGVEEAILSQGWPTMASGRNKALFLMLDSSEHKKNYIAGNETLSGKPMFVRGMPGEPWCAFIEVGNPLNNQDKIVEYVKSGYMVRVAADDTEPDAIASNPDRAKAALDSGAHLISTDFPAPAEGYWFHIPDGTPSRCNPVNAPEWCVSQDVEALSSFVPPR